MSCDIGSPEYLNNVLQTFLAEMLKCLECSALGVPPRSFIYHTTPPADCCDSLSVWYDTLAPTTQFPLMSDVALVECNSQRMVKIGMRLIRSCWPVVKDNALDPFPEPEAMQSAAEALLIDANVMYCCASSGFNGVMGVCDSLSIDKVQPLKPEGGCAGNDLFFLAELDPCC